MGNSLHGKSVEMFCGGIELGFQFEYGQILKKNIPKELFEIFKLLSDSANRRRRQLYNDNLPYDYMYYNCEMEIMNYVLQKYDLVGKIDWFTDQCKRGELYLVVKKNIEISPLKLMWIEQWCSEQLKN